MTMMIYAVTDGLLPTALWVALGSVLAGALGVPLPTFALLIYAGSLLARMPDGAALGALMVAAGVVCILFGDAIWFSIGRRFGAGILSLVCRLSISRDSCVRNTADLFARRGLKVLLVSRFLPGLSMVTSPLAGASGVSIRRFAVYDAVGAVVWIAVSLYAGAVFSVQIHAAMAILRHFGLDVGGAAVALTLIYLATKWVRRRMLIHQLRMARISVSALNELIASGTAPVIIDVRSPLEQKADPFLIPGALVLQAAELERALVQFPKDHPAIVYCACPNEVSAALMAKRLHRLGLTNIRPLAGGMDAWRAAGFPVDPVLTLTAEVGRLTAEVGRLTAVSARPIFVRPVLAHPVLAHPVLAHPMLAQTPRGRRWQPGSSDRAWR